MEGIYLLLGSNLGERHLIMKDAVDMIEKNAGTVISSSKLYETEAWGLENQPDFINQVVKIKTLFNPHELLDKIIQIEKDLGRKRYKKWDSRLIDIDILFYHDMIIKSEKLTIPHPQVKVRKFALAPLNEIAPKEIFPGESKTINDLTKSCPDKLKVTVFGQ